MATTRPRLRGLVLLLALVGPAVLGAQERSLPAPATMIGLAHAVIRQGVPDRGLANTLTLMMSPDAALIWPGMPVVTGSQRIATALNLLDRPGETNFQVQPLRMLLARDTSAMLVLGVAHYGPTDGSPGQFGRYLMAWRRVSDGWRLAAFGLIDLPAASLESWPDSLEARGPESVLVSRGDPAPFVGADLAFASAARDSAVPAFHHWAADDAVVFTPDGLLWRGKDAIAGVVSRLGEGRWHWRPMAAGASDDGSLGWTVGEVAVILSARLGRPERVIRSSYMTLWQRQEDGSLRFISTGRSAGP